jgi:hypothetical protein
MSAMRHFLLEYIEQHPDNALPRSSSFTFGTIVHWIRTNCELFLSAYRKRMAMSSRDVSAYAAGSSAWQEEEVFYSQLEIARLMIWLARPRDDVVQEYLAAYAMRPLRGEALYGLAMYFLELQGDAVQVFLFAKAGMDLPRPNPNDNASLDK